MPNLQTLFFQNIGIKQTVAKNIFWLALSAIIPKILTAVLVIFIARYLGVEEFGKFSFAFSFVVLFSFIADFGFVLLTIREVARNASLAKKYVGNIILIKLVLAAITFLAISLIVNFLNKTQDVKTLIYLAATWMVVESFVHFFQSIFRAFEKMEYEALSKIIYSLCLFFLAMGSIYFNFGAQALAKSYVLSILISLVFTLGFIWKKFFKFKVEVDFKFWKELFFEAWPFVAFTVFAIIYFQIATVILSLMATDSAVGLYSIAFNSVAVFLIFSDIVAGSAMPTLSKLFGKSNLFFQITKKLILFMLIAGVFLAVVLFLGAGLLIGLIYGGEFISSVPAFQIMVWILPIRFMNYLFGVSLMAANLQKKRLNAAIVCAIFNVAINLILIPAFSFIGASIATLITEMILFFLYFSFYKKAIKFSRNEQK